MSLKQGSSLHDFGDARTWNLQFFKPRRYIPPSMALYSKNIFFGPVKWASLSHHMKIWRQPRLNFSIFIWYDDVSPCVHLQKHDEFHQMFSATKHKTMSIQEHLDSQRYQPSEKCTTHTKKPVKMACTECCRFFCDDCNLQSNCNLEGKFFPILLQISYLVAFTLISPYFIWNTWYIVWGNHYYSG